MKKLRRFLVVGVMVLTAVGMSGLLSVSPVKASASAGDLIKMAGNSSVYYLGSDSKRYVFPNSTTYFSWYPDFSGVITIPASELQSYALGGNVTMRPGTKLVKITTDPSVYAVEPNGTLRKIQTEAQAAALYGTNWNQRVVDVPDAFFTNYTIGSVLPSGQYAIGSLVKNASGADIYYYDGTNYRKVADEATFNANRFQMANVLTSSSTITAGGTQVTTAEFVNVAQGGNTNHNVSTGSGLMVSLASNTPAAATIPSNASGVVFTKFNVTASNDGNVVLDTIKVKRTGVGPYNDMSAVYLYDGDIRLTTARTIASDTNEAEFSALNYTITAGTTKTLSIVANIGNNKTGNHALGIASASAVNASGAIVSGSFPVTGNIMSLSSTSAGTATITGVTTGLTDPTIGDTGTAVASFKIEASEDAYLKSITLKQDGDITTSLLSNYKLYQGTTELPVTASVSGRKVSLALATPFKMLNGSAKTFVVKADISSSAETGKKISFFVDTAADLLVTSDAYGFGLSSIITGYNSTSKELTLKGGAITIANASAAAHDVKTDSTGVELARVNITSSADTVEFQKMTAQIVTTLVTDTTPTPDVNYGTYKDADNGGDLDSSETLLLRNIKVKDAVTGQILGSAKAITDATWTANAAGTNDADAVDATLTFAWDDYFTISKGTTRTLVLVADINSAQVSNVKYTGKFDFTSGNVTVKDSQDKSVTDIVPASLIASNPVTTKTSSLTVSLASSPESRTVVKGSTVDALGFILAAGSGSGNDVRVSALTLDTYVDADVDGTFVNKVEGTVNAKDLVQQVELYVDGVKIAGPVSIDSNGQAVFTSSKFVGGYYTVPAGTNKTVIVKAVASANAPFGGSDDAFSMTFNPYTAITAEDSNGAVDASPNSVLNGTTAPTVSIKVTGAGTITTALDSGRPDAQVVVAGASSEQELTRVKLTATKENFTIDKMTALVSSATSYDDVEYLKLYDSAGNALSGNVSLDSNGKASFTNLSITVTKGNDSVVIVKGKLSAIGERSTATDGTAGTGADSGDSLTVTLSTTSDDFHAIGVSSSTTDSAANALTGDQAMVVRKTKPTLAMLNLPVTSLANGTATLYRFSITADGNGDVMFKGITPTMTLNDAAGADLAITAGTVVLYDITTGETALNAVGVNASAFIAADNAVTIAKGTTRTFEIRGTVAGVATGDSINVKITKDTSADLDGVAAGTQNTLAFASIDANKQLIWSDKSADTNGLTSVEWMNSYLLTGWPTSVATLSK